MRVSAPENEWRLPGTRRSNLAVWVGGICDDCVNGDAPRLQSKTNRACAGG